MLEESARECDTALSLDPGNYRFRSCAWGFMQLGRTARAKDFVRPDAGSEWARYSRLTLLLREGNVEEAREAVKQMPGPVPGTVAISWKRVSIRKPGQRWTQLPTRWKPLSPAEPDPELAFYPGAILTFCGKKSAAVHMLKSAIDRDYCAYSAVTVSTPCWQSSAGRASTISCCPKPNSASKDTWRDRTRRKSLRARPRRLW